MTTAMDRLQQILASGTGQKRVDDGLFKTVDDSLKIYRREGIFDIEKPLRQPNEHSKFQCDGNGCTKSFSSIAEHDLHYNSNHRYECFCCQKILQSAHLLDLHLVELHDHFFRVSCTVKPMYRCFIETCKIVFWTYKERDNHCLEVHKLSQSFLLYCRTKKNNRNEDNDASTVDLGNMSII